jgi:hypothetical protein
MGEPPGAPPEDRLDSWEEIAAYLTATSRPSSAGRSRRGRPFTVICTTGWARSMRPGRRWTPGHAVETFESRRKTKIALRLVAEA